MHIWLYVWYAESFIFFYFVIHVLSNAKLGMISSETWHCLSARMWFAGRLFLLECELGSRCDADKKGGKK